MPNASQNAMSQNKDKVNRTRPAFFSYKAWRLYGFDLELQVTKLYGLGW